MTTRPIHLQQLNRTCLNYLESTGIWAKVEMGMWKTTKWNDNYCIVFELDKRTTFRPPKGDILCTQFTGFW